MKELVELDKQMKHQQKTLADSVKHYHAKKNKEEEEKDDDYDFDLFGGDNY
jgi:hypothetical protein